MYLLIAGLVLFFGVHSVSIVCPTWRNAKVAQWGELPWKAVYSLISAAGIALIVIGYGDARLNPVVLYHPPVFLRHITALLMLLVFPMLLSVYLPGHIRTTLKHPMLAAVKIWALAHLLANGTLADIALFGSFLAWAVADRISLKRRQPSPPPSLPRGKFNDLIAVVLGVGIYVAFVLYLHVRWFGVSPTP